MKHLNLELEKLEQRIAPGGISLGGSIGLGVGVYVGGGTNGTCGSLCNSVTGYDTVTGIGSPRASVLVPALANR